MKRIIFVLLTISGLIYYGCKSNPIKNDHYCGLIDSSTIILSVIYPDIKNHIDYIAMSLPKNLEVA